MLGKEKLLRNSSKGKKEIFNEKYLKVKSNLGDSRCTESWKIMVSNRNDNNISNIELLKGTKVSGS